MMKAKSRKTTTVTKRDLSQIANPHAPVTLTHLQSTMYRTAYRDPEPAKVPYVQQADAGQRATCCQWEAGTHASPVQSTKRVKVLQRRESLEAPPT